MRRRLALPVGLAALALAGCEADHVSARGVLADRLYTRIALRAEPVVGSPCDWSEPFRVAYTATRDGMRVAGTLCAASESLADARLLQEREVGRAPAWDSFRSTR